MANVPFINNDCGKASGVTTPQGGALNAGDQVEINGSTDLSTCIVGNDGARVYSVHLINQAGFFRYVVNVVHRGPGRLGVGSTCTSPTRPATGTRSGSSAPPRSSTRSRTTATTPGS